MSLDLELNLWIEQQGGLSVPGGALKTEDGQYLLTEDGQYLLTEDGVGMPEFSNLTEATVLDDNDVLCFADPSNQNFKINKANLSATLSPFFEANLVDEVNATYMYYGGNNNNAWQINRVLKSSGVKDTATESNNPGTVDLNTAWTNRGSLNYL